ncbi:MAG: FMN-binding negative transcriptional regulator [Massilia sp.]
MYSPKEFIETRLDVLHGLIEANPLGAVVRHGADGLSADHIPFEIVAPSEEAPFGTLRAHVARANPLWQQDGQSIMVLFQAESAYITPAWYEEKARSGKVVPTWNYAAVHAHGVLRSVDDPAWLLALLTRLTARNEANRAAPWAVQDAPADYLARLTQAIVGIELRIERIDGKFKQSQNKSPADRARIAEGLRSGL